jgi:dTMP kinase
MELKGIEFHRRVRQGFLAQAHSQPDQYLVIDASGDADSVAQALVSALETWSRSAHSH